MADHPEHGARASVGPTAENMGREVGWYQDIAQPGGHRYWDGASWTNWTDRTAASAIPPDARPAIPRPRGRDRVLTRQPGEVPDPGPLVRSFTWDNETDALDWSTQNYVVHGYEPGQVAADVPLMLRHKLPADRGRTERVMEWCRTAGGSFSLHHRIVDAHDRLRVVVTVAVETATLDAGRPLNRRIYRGHVADVTDTVTRDTTQAVVASRMSVAAIQQSLAVLQMLLDLPEEGAMTILRRYSSHHNIKLSIHAQDVMTGTRLPWFREEPKDAAAARRLLTWAAEQRGR